MASVDAKDSTSVDAPVPDYESFLTKGVKGLRVGVPKEYRVEGMSKEIEKLWDEGIAWLKAAGADIIAPSDMMDGRVGLIREALEGEERRAKEKLEDLVVKIQPVNYSNVMEVETMVKKLLTSRGSVNIDKRTNTLILKDIPSVVEEAVALVVLADKDVVHQEDKVVLAVDQVVEGDKAPNPAYRTSRS